MAVTADERRLADRMARDTASYERRAVALAAQVGWRAQRAALASWRAGLTWQVEAGALAKLDEGAAVLGEVMALAYLAGLQRERREAPLRLSAVSTAIAQLRDRLDLTVDQIDHITKIFGAQAVVILEPVRRSVEKKLHQAMIGILDGGMHRREGIAVLRQAFDAAGVTPDNSFQLESIYRTQMNNAYSAARWQQDHDPVLSEILWGYKYVTVGDDRVRPEHMGLDGVTLPKDDPFWNQSFPPNGWACRCQAISIYDEEPRVEAPATFRAEDAAGRTIEVRPGPDPGFDYNPGLAYKELSSLARVPGMG